MLDPIAAPDPAATLDPAHTAPDQAPASGLERPPWTELMGPVEWEVYQGAIRAMAKAGIPFMLGGAFGLAMYTGRWRNTKDLDLFVLPEDRDRAVAVLTDLGFSNYYDTLPYDRAWIYRGTRCGIIVDIIWATPNQRSIVDAKWFEHAPRLLLRTEPVSAIPAEELIWIKLYVLQKDRSDWPDLINLLYATSASLDWKRLVARLQGDLPLLTGLLAVFAWACPNRIADIPARLRKAAGISSRSLTATEPDLARIKLLDSRPWFAALQPVDRPMQL